MRARITRHNRSYLSAGASLLRITRHLVVLARHGMHGRYPLAVPLLASLWLRVSPQPQRRAPILIGSVIIDIARRQASQIITPVTSLLRLTNQELSIIGSPAALQSTPDQPSLRTSADLYVVMASFHGLVRGAEMELGRDSDTGGQVLLNRNTSVYECPT